MLLKFMLSLKTVYIRKDSFHQVIHLDQKASTHLRKIIVNFRKKKKNPNV